MLAIKFLFTVPSNAIICGAGKPTGPIIMVFQNPRNQYWLKLYLNPNSFEVLICKIFPLFPIMITKYSCFVRSLCSWTLLVVLGFCSLHYWKMYDCMLFLVWVSWLRSILPWSAVHRVPLGIGELEVSEKFIFKWKSIQTKDVCNLITQNRFVNIKS